MDKSRDTLKGFLDTLVKPRIKQDGGGPDIVVDGRISGISAMNLLFSSDATRPEVLVISADYGAHET